MRLPNHQPACNGLCIGNDHHLYPGDTLWRMEPEDEDGPEWTPPAGRASPSA